MHQNIEKPYMHSTHFKEPKRVYTDQNISLVLVASRFNALHFGAVEHLSADYGRLTSLLRE